MIMDNRLLESVCEFKNINKLTDETRKRMLEVSSSIQKYLSTALMENLNSSLCGASRALQDSGFTIKQAAEVLYKTDAHRDIVNGEVERALDLIYGSKSDAPIKRSDWRLFEANIEDVKSNLKHRSIEPLSEEELVAKLGDAPEIDNVSDFLAEFFKGVDRPVYIGNRYQGMIAHTSSWLMMADNIVEDGYDQLIANPMRRTLTTEERVEKVNGKLKYASGGRCLEFASETLDVITYEADKMPPKNQLGVIRYLARHLPLVSVLFSAGKSYHATFSAKGVKDIHALRKMFVDLGGDCAVLSPAQLTRLGAVNRSDKGKGFQRVLWINGDARHETVDPQKLAELLPESAEDESKPMLPAVVDADSLMTSFPTRPEQLIEGVIGLGDKLILSASSKAGKTWLMLHLAYAVQNGDDWLGHKCKKKDVLYVNFELTEPWLAERFRLITKDKHFQEPPSVLNLRGFNVGWEELSAHITTHIKNSDKDYGLIILDPIYKMLGDTDENSNGDVAKLLNALERMAHDTKTATAFSHHHSKGNKSGVDAIERMSGAGVWGREPDAIIDLCAHAEDNHWVVDTTARNFSKPPKVVVRCDFPNFVPVDDLDAGDLKKAGGSKQTLTADNVLDVLTLVPLGMKKSLLVDKVMDAYKCSKSLVYSKISELEKSAELYKDGDLLRKK